MTNQHAAPASSGTQVVSAPPVLLARITFHNATAAPAQTGRSRMAMRVLIHFGMSGRISSKFQVPSSKFRACGRDLPENLELGTWNLELTLTSMTKDEVLQIFRDTGALLNGHFVLRSGLHSREFFQCALALQQMPIVEKLGAALAEKVRPLGATTVIAPALGGLVIGQEVARQLRTRFIFAEKEEGKLVMRRGFKIARDEKKLIVEDVITKGGRVQETIDIVRAN